MVWHGCTRVNDQLVLVGGKTISTNKATNVLGVWDEESQTWTHPFPEMPTPRYLLSVVSYQRWLVVAGGKDVIDSFDKVELLDTHLRQWYEGPSLPSGYSEMSSAISGSMWYLSGGFTYAIRSNKHVFSWMSSSFKLFHSLLVQLHRPHHHHGNL